jgi:NAD/NADP transhydrogenase alpha subunit
MRIEFRRNFAAKSALPRFPRSSRKLIKLGFAVSCSPARGARRIQRDAYQAAARDAPDARALWAKSDIVVQVRASERRGGRH